MTAIPSSLQPLDDQQKSGWREQFQKDKRWSDWIGLGMELIVNWLFARHMSRLWIAVAPAKWSTWTKLIPPFSAITVHHLAQFLNCLLPGMAFSTYWSALATH